MKKKFLSALLAVFMVFSLIPSGLFTVSAATVKDYGTLTHTDSGDSVKVRRGFWVEIRVNGTTVVEEYQSVGRTDHDKIRFNFAVKSGYTLAGMSYDGNSSKTSSVSGALYMEGFTETLVIDLTRSSTPTPTPTATATTTPGGGIDKEHAVPGTDDISMSKTATRTGENEWTLNLTVGADGLCKALHIQCAVVFG